MKSDNNRTKPYSQKLDKTQITDRVDSFFNGEL